MAGLRSAPPPNQRLVVVRKRVFMCTAGTCGFAMWATRLMPVAKKRGSSSAPGMDLANSGLNCPPINTQIIAITIGAADSAVRESDHDTADRATVIMSE